MKKLVLAAFAAVGLFATAGVASAHPPGYYGGPRYYAPPPVVRYYAPPPIVYAPPPVVVVRPAPVFVQPPVYQPWYGGYNSFNFGYSRPGFGFGFNFVR